MWRMVVVLTLGALGGSCAGSAPTAPSADAAARITIDGPASIPPGGTGRFVVTLQRADGTTEDVTSRVDWQPFKPEVVSFDSSGIATAHGRGETGVLAVIGTFRQPFTVVVLEPGTFRLTGQLLDGDVPRLVSGALVEVLEGVGAGLRYETSINGWYGLYGVAGDIRVRVSAAGFVSQTLELTVNATTNRNVMLSPVPAVADLTGLWRVTIVAPDRCAQLPVPARSVGFTARLLHAGSQVTAHPADPTLSVADPIAGRVFGDELVLMLHWWPGDVIEFPYYGLLVALPPRGLAGLRGTIRATVDGPTAVGTLDGAIDHFFQSVTLEPTTICAGPIAVELRRD